jgi:hypothetical protein
MFTNFVPCQALALSIVSWQLINREKFSRAVKNLLANQKGQWNPISRKVTPWIDMKSMNKIYGDKRWSFW